MKPTLKSINDNLPRFDAIRRAYMSQDATGFTDGRDFLAAAFADLDEWGNVCNIALYATGDAMEERHYHAEGNACVVDITDQIEDAISGARLGDYGYDSKRFRACIVSEIRDRITEQTGDM